MGADTSRGDYPNDFCCECGVLGCVIRHWGPKVPREPQEKKHSFCYDCWDKRREHYYNNYNEENPAKPLPENHVCKRN
jgi:hypothetical protein